MAEVTVSQLAEVVGASVDRLLKQMAEAGLKHTAPNETGTDEEKQQLLAYLKSLHGEKAATEPRKITQRRKTVSSLKTRDKKTVNVEVRKKRTYVKREDLDDQQADTEEFDAVAETEVVDEAPELTENIPAQETVAEAEQAAEAPEVEDIAEHEPEPQDEEPS